MGTGSGKSQSATSKSNAFKLFEYVCPNCKSKRPIQYFYKGGTFLPQTPRVVCGDCNNSVVVQPFKTADYCCPSCKKCQKVRLPAKAIPLNMYNRANATCNCGFRGEVSVGRLMDVACSQCWGRKRELRDIWAEDGDEVKTFCESCQGYERAFARAPQKKGAVEQVVDMEYTCENCFRDRPIGAEELLKNQGLAFCSLCGWVGYPEVRSHGSHAGHGCASDTLSAKPQPQDEQTNSSKKQSDKSKKPSVKTQGTALTSVIPS
jgi:hypothetical protein